MGVLLGCEGPVLIGQVHGDRVGVGAVGVGVGLEPTGGVGVGVPVAPVHDPGAHGVLARVGDRAQGQGVGRALVHVGVPGDRDRGSDVVHGHRLGVGPVGEGPVLIGQVHGDRVGVGAVGVGVGLE